MAPTPSTAETGSAASAVPTQVGEGLDTVLTRDELDERLRACADRFRDDLDEVLTALVPYGKRGLTEFGLVMLGLPRHAALAASDAADREEAETWVKLSIHWTRAGERWKGLLTALTGVETDQLQPLPTTSALQFALEELASRDGLAYYAVARGFGLPGDTARVERLRHLLGELAEDDPAVRSALGDWAGYAASTDDNYASVKSLREIGWLRTGQLRQVVVDTRAPLASQGWRRTERRVRELAETVQLAGFGVRHFYGESQETWPRRRPAWDGVRG